MSRPPQLSAEQEAEAQRLFQILKSTTDDDLLALARLLAATKDRDLLGQTEFEVRDRVHPIGGKALQTAVAERKKGGTKGPACSAPLAKSWPASNAGRAKTLSACWASYDCNAPLTTAGIAVTAIILGKACSD